MTVSACKDMSNASREQSIEAMRTGDATQRDAITCGSNPIDVTKQSPEEAVKAVYSTAPDFYYNLFGKDPNKVVVLTDDTDCVCKGARACWGEIGREQRCRGDGQNSLALFTNESAANQRISIRIYMAKDSQLIHSALLATMGYAWLDNRYPKATACKSRKESWTDRLELAKKDLEKNNDYILSLESDLKILAEACQESQKFRKGGYFQHFAEQVLLPDNEKDLEAAQNFFKPMLERYNVSTLKEAAANERVQDLLVAESIESFFCSPESNKALMRALPGAFAQVQATFLNPRSFPPANAK